MEDLNHRLLEAFHGFQKLPISALLPENISKNEFATLMCIEHGAGRKEGSKISVSALARDLHVTTPAVSRTLKGLEEKGLVFREVDTKDRRNTFVTVTENGRIVRKEAEEEMSDFFTTVIQNMEPEEIERLIDYLHQFFQTAQEELDRRKQNKTEMVK